MSDVVAAAEAAVRSYPGSTKVVALLMDKHPGSLASELLEAGASVNAKNENGQTSLHYAASRNRTSVRTRARAHAHAAGPAR